MGFLDSLVNTVKNVGGKVLDYGFSPYTTAAGLVTGHRGRDYVIPALEATGAAIPGNPAAGALAADAARRAYTTATQKMVGKVIDPATGKAVRTNPAAPGAPAPGVPPPPSALASLSNEPPMPSSPSPSSGYSSVLSSSTPSGPSAEEQAHSANVSSIARLLGGQGENLYNVSNPAYKQALDYYGQILSGDKAHVTQAIAPEAEAIAELTSGEQKGIANSSLRGGARDTAQAEAARKGTGEIADLVPKARQNAAAAGSALALQGMGLANQQQGQSGSLYNSLADRELQDRLGTQGLGLQAQQLKLSEALGMKGLDVQQMGLALQEKLGMRGLDLQRATAMDSNALQRELGLANINLSQQQVDLLKQQFQQALKEGKGKAAGDLANILIKALPTVLGLFKSSGSDISTTSGSFDSGD